MLNKYREALLKNTQFPTSKGNVPLRVLFSMPIVRDSKYRKTGSAPVDNFTLEYTANLLAKDIHNPSTISFSTKKPTKSKAELKLELVQDIVEYRQEKEKKAVEANIQRTATLHRKQKLQERLVAIQEGKIEELSEEEIRKELGLD
jgi:hypothetical protein